GRRPRCTPGSHAAPDRRYHSGGTPWLACLPEHHILGTVGVPLRSPGGKVASGGQEGREERERPETERARFPTIGRGPAERQCNDADYSPPLGSHVITPASSAAGRPRQAPLSPTPDLKRPE